MTATTSASFRGQNLMGKNKCCLSFPFLSMLFYTSCEDCCILRCNLTRPNKCLRHASTHTLGQAHSHTSILTFGIFTEQYCISCRPPHPTAAVQPTFSFLNFCCPQTPRPLLSLMRIFLLFTCLESDSLFRLV